MAAGVTELASRPVARTEITLLSGIDDTIPAPLTRPTIMTTTIRNIHTIINLTVVNIAIVAYFILVQEAIAAGSDRDADRLIQRALPTVLAM